MQLDADYCLFAFMGMNEVESWSFGAHLAECRRLCLDWSDSQQIGGGLPRIGFGKTANSRWTIPTGHSLETDNSECEEQ
jgi:hypothetical protein